EAMRVEAVQIEHRLARAGLLMANDPLEIVGEEKSGGIVGRLRIKQVECALPAHPELPFPVVRIPVHVLLDRYRAVRRFPAVFFFDVVTRGRSRRLSGGRHTADADSAGNEQADPGRPTLHLLAPSIRSAISRPCRDQVHGGGTGEYRDIRRARQRLCANNPVFLKKRAVAAAALLFTGSCETRLNPAADRACLACPRWRPPPLPVPRPWPRLCGSKSPAPC